MPSIRKILFFTFVFLTIHALSLSSFFYTPARPVLYWTFVIAAIIVCSRPQYLLLPILASILFDSSGHLFEWQGISLRLMLLGITMAAWFVHAIRDHTLIGKLKTWATPLFGFIFFVVAFATYNGFQNGHAMQRVIADAIPYLYLLLFYPLRDAFVWVRSRSHDERAWFASHGWAVLFGSILGTAILSLVVLFLFSSRLQEIHGLFYVWWRDWVVGKATSTGNGFFRIVSPIHLLQTALVPAIVYRLLFIERLQQWSSAILILATILIPAFNFSRIYFLAFIPATFMLTARFPWKKVCTTLGIIVLIALSEYVVANVFASRGASFGFQFIAKQSRGVVESSVEESATARAAIFPHLLRKISERPFFGEGLGASVTYFDPLFRAVRTTPHLDWGYLELAVELGLLAMVFLIVLVITLLWHVRRDPYATSVIVFLLATTLTSPAIFHVLGFVLFAALSAYALQPRLYEVT